MIMNFIRQRMGSNRCAEGAFEIHQNHQGGDEQEGVQNHSGQSRPKVGWASYGLATRQSDCRGRQCQAHGHHLLLIATLMVLMNLERTFRASVGTMRWRIKFMIMGLGMLFAVRLYTQQPGPPVSRVNLSLDALDSAALLVALLLILRSLLRAGHFDVSVYPSHSVLHNSLTILLAGVYLLIVGLFARVVTYLGGDAAFTLKAFLVNGRPGGARHPPAFRFRCGCTQNDSSAAIFKGHVRLSHRLAEPDRSMASRIDQMDLCRATVNLVADIFRCFPSPSGWWTTPARI